MNRDETRFIHHSAASLRFATLLRSSFTDIVHWSKDEAGTGRWSIDTLLRKLSRLMSIGACM